MSSLTRLLLTRHVTKYPPVNIGEYPSEFLIFKTAPVAKHSKANKHNSLIVTQKHALGNMIASRNRLCSPTNIPPFSKSSL